jgi:hypothetical protein
MIPCTSGCYLPARRREKLTQIHYTRAQAEGGWPGTCRPHETTWSIPGGSGSSVGAAGGGAPGNERSKARLGGRVVLYAASMCRSGWLSVNTLTASTKRAAC